MADNNTPKNTLKQWFVTGAKPQQAQYWAWLDSYWHKSEPISINAIDGLGEILGNKVDADQLALYAKKDASNIDVPTWKTRLGVGELPPNIGTIDYTNSEGFSYVGNAYKKVANPGDGKTYVLNIDGTAVSSDTFGKNITNSSNTTTGSYLQTQRASDTFDWETNGARYAVKSLPDKSADAAFDDFVGKNSQGQFARVGYQAFYKAFQGFSAQQSLNLSQLLAGGSGSDGAPNVNLISPPIIQNQYDSIEYVLLRGTNLKLNTTAMSVEILNSQQNIVATIPNNQIQLSDDGLSLVFYYNFHNFPVGTYYIKLVSGAKSYITTLDLRIVQNVVNVDLANITWEKVYSSEITPNQNDIAQGANVSFVTPISAKETPVLSIKSSELFAQGEDFYIEMKVLFGAKKSANPSWAYSYIGLGYSGTANNLTVNSLVFVKYQFDGISNNNNAATGINVINNNLVQKYYQMSTPNEITVVFIKTGNLFRTVLKDSNNIETKSNNSGYSLFFNVMGRQEAQIIQSQITKAFKFN